MRRITTWLLSTITALVLLFRYHTSTGSSTPVANAESPNTQGDTAANGSGDTGSGTDAGTDSGTDTGTGSGTDTGESGGSSTQAGSKTYLGEAIQTHFGPVQVQITVANGKITTSEVTQVPWNNHRDQEINAYAVPILNEETVTAQSADIDMVGGATFTSDGYIQSLQSAIDQANL